MYQYYFKIIIGIIFLINQISDSYESDNKTDLGKFRVVCYYASWSIYRAGIGKFTPGDINPNLCTHIVYAFAGLTEEGILKSLDNYGDIELGGYTKFTGLKSQNKDLKTMLSFGGTSEGYPNFAAVIVDFGKRQKFIKNSIEFLRQYNFDGLDLDWQFPDEKDTLSYSTLIQELREGYERESLKTGLPRLLLSITLHNSPDHSRSGYDVPKLTKYVDWMNTLNYDYHRDSEPIVNHHSQLYGVDEKNDYYLNANYTMTYYIESGADRDKLVLGIPTYGRAFTLSDQTMTDIRSPAVGPGLKGDQTNAGGFLAYYEICKKIKDEGWNVKHPHPNAMGPYAYKDNQWVGFDDEEIIRKKSKYVAENNLGGVMFWVIEYDDFLGYCTGKKFPLIEAAREILIVESRFVVDSTTPTQGKPEEVEDLTSKQEPTISTPKSDDGMDHEKLTV